MDLKDLEDKNTINWRKKWQITIPAKDYSKKQSRNRQFKTIKDNKLKINPKHLAHYILLQIAYIDNLYNIHLTPKKKKRYLIRIYWS